jgi:hypothetical protein
VSTLLLTDLQNANLDDIESLETHNKIGHVRHKDGRWIWILDRGIAAA